MKNSKYCLFLLVIILGLTNCREEKDPILEYAEQVLPGLWKIDSVNLPRDPTGISYQGTEFFVDTTLFNLGSFEINPFSTDTAGIYETRLPCELIIDGEPFPVSMDNIYIAGRQLWTNFGSNRPPGVYPIETHPQEFYSSARIFNGNYVVYINDVDHMVFVRSNDAARGIIYLSRI